MKLTGLLILIAVFAVTSPSALGAPVHLRCDHLKNPLGVDREAPELSWWIDNPERNWEQAAYQILVANTRDLLEAGRPDVWDSGKIASSASVDVRYAGPRLESQHRYYWKVRAWDTRGQVSESTEVAWWEMGLLGGNSWKAQWIAWDNPETENDRSGLQWIWASTQNAHEVPPQTTATFRARVALANAPADAALILAVRGDYTATVNGHPVCHKSGWLAFDRCDLTEELVTGTNVVEIRVTSQDSTATAGLTGLLKVRSGDAEIRRYFIDQSWESRLEPQVDWQPAQVVGDLKDPRFGDPGQLPAAASYLRKVFPVATKVQRARLFATAMGSYQFFLNGQRVGSDALTPEFTDYRKRVVYQTYDVTRSLKLGKNMLGALLGDGWYGSGLTWIGLHFFPPPLSLVAQLEIEYTNGRRETLVTDGTWRGAASPIVRSDIYAGEVYDARLEQTGWQTPVFDDSSWAPVRVVPVPSATVSSQVNLPTRTIMTVLPKKVRRGVDGSYIFDMGQNMVGWCSLRVKGASGTRIRMRFAEVLKPDGTLYTENLRNAEATDVYILKGGEKEEFTPHFTFHGFRYVAVTGFSGEPTLATLSGQVVSSVDAEPSATLTTSSALVNRMWSVGLWGQRGNFLSIPTDCPQRDERLGWMGDAGVFWRTGSYNFDIAAFSHKFVQDIADAQSPQGVFTNVSPDTLPGDAQSEERTGAPGWGDAGVIVPWTTWLQYGDTDVVLENWDSMQRWMQFIQDSNPDFLRKNGLGPNFGDWLAPDEGTDKNLLATAYWAIIAEMMSQMARAVGKEPDAKHYDTLVENIRMAFRTAYIRDDGMVGTGTQTSYIVALYANLAPRELEPMLMQNLVKDIASRDWHLSTGFLGTPFLLFTLSDHGRTDVAYRLLLNRTYPSWGYMLSKDATTWWERWNGDTGDPAMNSYNHYAFGSVVAWVYRYVVGIDASVSAPGFKKIVVHPHVDPRVSSAKGEYDSAYGKISSEWTNAKDKPFRLRLKIPANTTADVFLPAKAHARVFEGRKRISAETQGEQFLLHIGSGVYDFRVE